MKKQGKIKTGLAIVVIALIATVIYFAISSGGAGWRPLSEHAEPVDLSTEQEGQGVEVHFYDDDGNQVEIPEWFRIMTTGIVGAIVEHPPAPSCTTSANCPGAGTNPNIDCWQGGCVLTNIAAMDVVVKVTNGADFDFEDVYIASASPVGFAGAFPSVIQDLPSGSTINFPSNVMNFEDLGWIGTTQTFDVVIEGISTYDGKTQQSSDSITLKFTADPTGGFSVVLQTGVPQ